MRFLMEKENRGKIAPALRNPQGNGLLIVQSKAKELKNK